MVALRELIGRALQLRDDLDDCLGVAAQLGKPTGQDVANGRPNAVIQGSVADTERALEATVREALALLEQRSPQDSALATLVHMVSGRGEPLPE